MLSRLFQRGVFLCCNTTKNVEKQNSAGTSAFSACVFHLIFSRRVSKTIISCKLLVRPETEKQQERVAGRVSGGNNRRDAQSLVK